jgi:hypothetical protein
MSRPPFDHAGQGLSKPILPQEPHTPICGTGHGTEVPAVGEGCSVRPSGFGAHLRDEGSGFREKVRALVGLGQFERL